MSKEGKIQKLPQALIKQPKDVTDHFRDPQFFCYKEEFYALIGAQNKEGQGLIKLYKAINNDVTNWQLLGDLDIGEWQGQYMVECPHLVFIDDKPVLISSPQGLDRSELHYDNIYPNTYQVFDHFDPKEARLVGGQPIQNLDFGFETYATQAFNSPDSRVLAVSWVGLPDINYPTDRYDYQGALSLVKELSLKNGQLYQFPVDNLKKLRQEAQVFQSLDKSSNTYELVLDISADQKAQIQLFANQHSGLLLTVDTQKGYMEIDRSKAGQPYAQAFGQQRSCQIPQEHVTLNIYVDKALVEIFVNQGQRVLTSRVFPDANQTGIKHLVGQVTGHYYEMRY